MPQQFTVPQFIAVEDKILGPMTVRQFVIMLAGMGLIVGAYQLLYKLANSSSLFLFTAVGIFMFTVLFAFIRVNGRPFHLFLLNLLESFRNPGMRLWNNDTTERIQYRREPPPPTPPPTKHPMNQTNLARLAMLVDTGGAFHDDEDILYWGQTLPEAVQKASTNELEK